MTGEIDELQEEPVWSDDKARLLQGAIVIVGFTYIDGQGDATAQHQIHGVVIETDPSKGIGVECHGEVWKGEIAWLPPDTRAWVKAPPGEYRLRSTGEVVIDPDFTSSWTRQGPEQHN